jgi:hypothetical protein
VDTPCLWKSLVDFPTYEVSSLGTIRRNGKLLSPQKDKGGYLRVRLYVNKKKYTVKVHREVAKSFLPNENNLPQVNHIDGDKSNNTLQNLEWIDNSGNQKHAIFLGLKQIAFGQKAPRFTGAIKVLDKFGFCLYTLSGNKELRDYGFDFRLVSACLKGKRKSHKGCTFVKLEKELNK